MKIDPGQTVSFSWFNPTGIKVQGKPYGVLIDSETGLFMETDDHYSKLTPLKKGNGVMKPITSVEGVDEALDYIKEQESYTSDKREEIVDRLHAGTELKEFIICSKCHSNNGIMDFKELGYEQTRINQLIKMEVGGMLTNYDTFYFPDIAGRPV